jgi:hypothetical protein
VVGTGSKPASLTATSIGQDLSLKECYSPAGAEGVCLSVYARAWKSRPRLRPLGSLKPSGSLAALAEYSYSSARRILRRDYLAVVAGHL